MQVGMIETKHYKYELVHGSIHYITFLKADVASLTQAIHQFDTIIGNHDSDEPLLMVSDTSLSGTMPFQPVITSVRELHQKHGDEKFSRIRLAFVVKNTFFVGSFITLIGALRSGGSMRSFTSDQREDAIVWLKTFEEELVSNPE